MSKTLIVWSDQLGKFVSCIKESIEKTSVKTALGDIDRILVLGDLVKIEDLVFLSSMKNLGAEYPVKIAYGVASLSQKAMGELFYLGQFVANNDTPYVYSLLTKEAADFVKANNIAVEVFGNKKPARQTKKKAPGVKVEKEPKEPKEPKISCEKPPLEEKKEKPLPKESQAERKKTANQAENKKELVQTESDSIAEKSGVKPREKQVSAAKAQVPTRRSKCAEELETMLLRSQATKSQVTPGFVSLVESAVASATDPNIGLPFQLKIAIGEDMGEKVAKIVAPNFSKLKKLL